MMQKSKEAPQEQKSRILEEYNEKMRFFERLLKEENTVIRYLYPDPQGECICKVEGNNVYERVFVDTIDDSGIKRIIYRKHQRYACFLRNYKGRNVKMCHYWDDLIRRYKLCPSKIYC
jgi:hypothetical protein